MEKKRRNNFTDMYCHVLKATILLVYNYNFILVMIYKINSG